MLRRPRTIAFALFAIAVALAFPVASAPAYASAQPRTGFEESGGARWTTQEEEAEFLGKLVQRSDRIAVEEIGTTRQDRPLRLVTIGRQHANVMLLTCSQHGDEPSGREACLSAVRDLALAKDHRTRSFLARTTVLVIPTANPDGRVADTRGNADGVDINRDHIALATNEGRAMAAVIRDHKPDIIYDLHEFGAEPPYYVKDVLSLWPRNLNVADAVHGEAKTLSEAYIRPKVEKVGFTSGVYGIWTDPVTGDPVKQVAGDGQERILRNTAGVKHAAGLLLETRQTPLTDDEKSDPAAFNRQRVSAQRAALSGAFGYVGDHRRALEKATAASRARGLADSGPVYLGGADNEPPTSEQTIADPPCAYALNAAQAEEVGDELKLHGVQMSREASGSALVPLRQEQRALIPLLLDERATYHIVNGRPVESC
ncbi:M14 family metallopeptidase [Streptomyces boninensis]|uniref:M14 family metallopeptidase n=1 Tax=Streptomyces boninensis TaxID=2039455 RepID=UPI003B20E3B6